jgi:hypothetical protein
MSAKAPAWSREFDKPIPLPDSRELRTLADAGQYVTALPLAVQKRAVWEAAAEILIKAATEQWPVMFADIAMRKALSADKPVSTGLHGGANQPQRKPARQYRIVR